MAKQRNWILIAIVCCLVYSMQSTRGMISPAMSDFMNLWPDVPLSTISLIMGVVSITGMVTSFITGFISGKYVSHKAMLVVGMLLIIIGGGAPFFFAVEGSSFYVVLVCRAILGFGLGITMALQGVLPVVLFETKQQAGILGACATTSSVITIIAPLLIAWILGFGSNFVWLPYIVFGFLGLLAVILFLPNMPTERSAPTEDKTEKKSKARIAPVAWVFILGIPLSVCFGSVFFIGAAPIIVGEGIGDDVTAGLVISLFGIGSLVGSLALAIVTRLLDKYTAAFGFILNMVGLGLFGFSDNLILLYIASFLAGAGFVGFAQPSVFQILGKIMEPEALTRANGFLMLFLGIGGFLTTYFMMAVEIITYSVDPRNSFLVAAVLLAVMAVVFIIASRGIPRFRDNEEVVATEK